MTAIETVSQRKIEEIPGDEACPSHVGNGNGLFAGLATPQLAQAQQSDLRKAFARSPHLCTHKFQVGNIPASFHARYIGGGERLAFFTGEVKFQVPADELRWNSAILRQRPDWPTMQIIYDHTGKPSGSWAFKSAAQFSEHVHRIDYRWIRGKHQFTRQGYWDPKGLLSASLDTGLKAEGAPAWVNGPVSIRVTDNEGRQILTALFSVNIATIQAEAARAIAAERKRIEAVPIAPRSLKLPAGCEPLRLF